MLGKQVVGEEKKSNRIIGIPTESVISEYVGEQGKHEVRIFT